MTNVFAISIDKQLKVAAPALALGVIRANVTITKHDPALWREIDETVKRVTREMKLETLGLVPEVRTLRETYKTIGKDPSRYRGSQEALFRRILQGKGLYQINTVVDINNLISLESKHSVGAYDLARLQPPLTFRIGLPGESYKGIGKETINIEELPVFADAQGPFGSPTSDSERAMILPTTKQVMLVIIAFSSPEGLRGYLQRAASLFERYAKSPRKSIETFAADGKDWYA